MRRALPLALASCLLACAPPRAPVSPEAGPRDVILQAFTWNVPRRPAEGSWWNHLAARAEEIAGAGFGAVWLPPPTKGLLGAEDVGYAVYDRYDLGEFDQRGSVATRYGTLAELQAAIAALHRAGVQVHVDVVMNHLLGADATEEVALLSGARARVHTRFDYPARRGAHSPFVWRSEHFNGSDEGGFQQWHAWDFAPYEDGDAYDALLGAEIRYRSPEVRAETIAWGKWLTARLSVDGYRLDAVKHLEPGFVSEWLDAVRGPRFAVAEVWNGDPERLLRYAARLGGRARLFDVALHYVFQHMSDGGGGFDMRALAGAGLVGRRPELSVTFVDNHDTVGQGPLRSPVGRMKLAAYAYVLTHPGVPCVFLGDYQGEREGEELRRLLAVRRAHAHGAARDLPETDGDVYAYARLGDAGHTGLLLLMNDGPAATRAVTSPFPAARMVDASGHVPGVVRTDARGRGTFPVPEGGYSLWVVEGG